MKRLIYIIPFVIMAYSCSYDDSWVQEEFQKQRDAVTNLEARCRQANENIISLEKVLTSIQEKNLVTSVSALGGNGELSGYEIFFQNGQSYKLYFGSDGKDGADGKDASDGADSHRPIISVKLDSDGKW